MTTVKNTKGTIKGVLLLIVLCTMLSGILSHTLTAAAQQTQKNTQYISNVFFDYAQALRSPVAVRTSEGTYYQPSTYLYYGRAYNSSTGTYMPMLNRVLAPFRDNAGNSGAIFLLAENIVNYSMFSRYSDDTVAGFMDDENSYVDSSLVSKVYSGAYTAYESSYVNMRTLGTLAQELDYIRAITKTDDAATVDGLYGLSTESGGYYWTVVDADGNNVGSYALLNNSRVFPLSAEEVYTYLGTERFDDATAQAAFKATDIRNGTLQSWWLRTAIGDNALSGSLVGIVDAHGRVTYASAQNTLANRNAFNIETDDIAFVERLSDGIYRLAFRAPEYKSGEQFQASIVDVKGDVVTVAVRNHIGQSGWSEIDDSCISYIIIDSQGNEKYYAMADRITTASGESEKLSQAEEYSFTLPECYEQGDSIKLFWERKDLTAQSYTSYVSNMVELGCIHTTEGGSPAYCHQAALCGACGEYYGSYDEDNHMHVTVKWVYNEDEGTHSRYCTRCDKVAYTERCTFGEAELKSPVSCEHNTCNGCSHEVDAPSIHSYDENGVCTKVSGEYHYSMPKLTSYANAGFEVKIATAGEWNALAEWLNGGGAYFNVNESKYIVITDDLDFSGIPFIPLGTEELPVKNLTVNAHHRTFSGMDYTAEGNAPAGVIAVGESIRISDLMITNSIFRTETVAGALVGKLLDTKANASSFRNIAVMNVALEAPYAGGIVGTLESEAELSLSFLYRVTSSGAHLDFSYDGGLIPDAPYTSGNDLYGGSYRLAAENNGADAFTAEEFASGIVTYRLREVDPKWRQTIGTDPCPRYAKDGDESGRVYKVVSCDGDSVIYSNENLGQISHADYVGYDPSTFEWIEGVGDFGIGFCIQVQCGLCGDFTPVEIAAEESLYYSYSRKFIARVEFNAYLNVNGSRIQVNSEPMVIYSTKLETLIGMTPVSVPYSGDGYYTDLLFGNLREGLTGYDFDAYFLDPVTNERIEALEYDYYGRPVYRPATVKNVGVYDVLLVGLDGFAGYEYLYENVFEIRKANVSVNPLDLVKTYDGTARFVPEYELTGDTVSGLFFDISIAQAPSAGIGRYTLKVTVDTKSHSHGDNVTVTLVRDTVEAVIAPDLSLTVENKSYPESFIYGESIPTPVASHFRVSEGAVISYEWFTAEYDYYSGYTPVSKVTLPKNAGDYILRVRASSSDGGRISASLDIHIEILPRQLHLELSAPDGAEKVVKYDYGSEVVYLYILDVGEEFSYRLSGFALGETLENSGLTLEIALRDDYGSSPDDGPSSGHPVLPIDGSYQVSYYVSGNPNYECDSAVVYISIKSPDYSYPLETEFVTDGLDISPNLLISGPAVGFVPDGNDFAYTITVRDINGDIVATKYADGVKSVSDIYLYNASSRTYYSGGSMKTERGAFTKAGVYTVTTQIESDTLTYTYEYTFELVFSDEQGNRIERIVDFGKYTVLVLSKDGSVTREAPLYAQQKLVMNLKPSEYNISSGRVAYDPKKVIMEAGYVIHLDHTLVDVLFYVDESQGLIYATGVMVVDKNGNDVSRLYRVERASSSWPSHTDSLNICHIFDTPCDHDCNVYGCEYVRAAAHSGGSATCQSLAVCDVCGTSYGDYSTVRHTSEHTVVYPNLDALEQSHLIVHTCCGTTKQVVAHTHITPATCTERAVCSACGWTYGELDSDNHSGDKRTYRTLGEYHETTHHCCGLVEREEHIGGEATCNAVAVCEHCKDGYGELAPDNHTKALQYLPDGEDGAIHHEYYACCGKRTAYAHFGGDATCNARAICTDCKAEYGALEPGDHASEQLRYESDMDNPSLHDIYHACCGLYIGKEYHLGGKANCQSPAICELCSTAYGERNDKLHASEHYTYYALHDDGEHHIKLTACCDELVGKEAHAYADASCTHPSLCACGATQGEKLSHIYDNDCDAFCNTCGVQTRAATFHEGKDGEPCHICGTQIPKEPMSGGAISAIATASTLAASTGGFALLWFVIKKKSLAELLALLLK